MTRNQWFVFYYKIFMSIDYSPKNSIWHTVYRGRNVPWLLGAQSKNEDDSIVQNGKGILDSTVFVSIGYSPKNSI